MDLYPTGMLALWGAVGFVETILAVRLGAWIHCEEPADVSEPAVGSAWR